MNPTEPANELVPCTKHRILITDDEKPVRDIFRLILSRKFPACQVDMAGSGEEALALFRQHHQGILLMDVKMPEMDGPTTFGNIYDLCREQGWEVPAIIFCTGFAPSLDLGITVPPGCRSSVIRKPIASDVLIATIQSYLPPAG
jgi:CheY-like chemotaxis protein